MKILEPQSGKKNHVKDYESYTHKKCSKCGIVKSIDEFGKSVAQTRLGWAYRSYCKQCNNKNCSVYGKNNRQLRNKRLRQWRKENPEKAKLNDLRGRIKAKYGLTLEQVEALKEHNDYKCWICNKESKRLVIDHDHKTGKVRGILCDLCNKHLGYFENMNIEKIQLYLDQECHADVLLKYANTD